MEINFKSRNHPEKHLKDEMGLLEKLGPTGFFKGDKDGKIILRSEEEWMTLYVIVHIKITILYHIYLQVHHIDVRDLARSLREINVVKLII